MGCTPYTDVKVSEVAYLFQTDLIALLTANVVDISYTDIKNHIIPASSSRSRSPGNPNTVISDPSVLNIGTNLWIPFPCTYFNGSDNNLHAIYMSYVVTPVSLW
ncbi:lysM domain-containing GPI-anchored protein 1-like [Ipomoea triloba]|uniref:lysM domain-containing GPI-anchored protein 1-like n=1 Tax=Ipomoea triloba TaxID=35885 RepID=UPI00125E2512|nr:lysM domain-containing GPI-anchored protein 1-like [Ipomoea triloba]